MTRASRSILFMTITVTLLVANIGAACLLYGTIKLSGFRRQMVSFDAPPES